MRERDPLADWRRNPFFVLEVGVEASRVEVERAGQRLLGLLALGSAAAARYETPFGPATRDEDCVREALATLRDPVARVVHELWATVVQEAGAPHEVPADDAWTGAERAIGWMAPWPG